jgi:hypothetical protein
VTSARDEATSQPPQLTNVQTAEVAKMKFLKVGRVAIITRGRYAGKKVREKSRLP